MTVEDRLATFVADLDVADLPDAVRGAVGTLLLDTSACMLAGLGDPVTNEVRAQIVARGGAAESSLVGHGSKVPAPQAALHNGMLAHWSEWDDTYDPGAVHGGGVIFPTLLAVGEACEATGEDFVCAAVAAFEVSLPDRQYALAPGAQRLAADRHRGADRRCRGCGQARRPGPGGHSACDRLGGNHRGLQPAADPGARQREERDGGDRGAQRHDGARLGARRPACARVVSERRLRPEGAASA
jgi:hypothetical protein